MMKLFAFLGSLFGAFVRALFFKSNDERLGASEERVKTLEKQIEVKKAMDEAPKVKSRAEILDILDKGQLAVLIGLFFFDGLRVPTARDCVPEHDRLDAPAERLDRRRHQKIAGGLTGSLGDRRLSQHAAGGRCL